MRSSVALSSVLSLVVLTFACGDGTDEPGVAAETDGGSVQGAGDGAPGQVDASVSSNDGGAGDGASVGDSAQSDATGSPDGASGCTVVPSAIAFEQVVGWLEQQSWCGRTPGGAVYCWGGRWLEDPVTHEVALDPQPLTVATLVPELASDVAQLAAGRDFICARKTNGQVLCWGKNNRGQVGDAAYTKSARATPTAVAGLLDTATDIAAGDEHACAVLTDKRVMCWGHNGFNMLGNASVPAGQGQFSRAPVVATGITGAVKMSLSESMSCARTDAGAVKCWGALIPTAGLDSNIEDVRVGAYGGCARTTTNTLKCWGENRAGVYTTDTIMDAQTVPGLTAGFTDFRVHTYHACVRMTSGVVKCWGLHFGGRTPALSYLAGSPSVPLDMVALGQDIAAFRFGAGSEPIGFDATTSAFHKLSLDYATGHSESVTQKQTIVLNQPTTCGPRALMSFKLWSEEDHKWAVVDEGNNVLTHGDLR